MKSRVLTMAVLIAPLMAGCAAVDLTADHPGAPPKCGIHQIPMHPERITVSGEGIYVLEYVDFARKHFPNHGGHLLNSEKENTPWGRDVIDWVCPRCDQAYQDYWKNEGTLQP